MNKKRQKRKQSKRQKKSESIQNQDISKLETFGSYSQVKRKSAATVSRVGSFGDIEKEDVDERSYSSSTDDSSYEDFDNPNDELRDMQQSEKFTELTNKKSMNNINSNLIDSSQLKLPDQLDGCTDEKIPRQNKQIAKTAETNALGFSPVCRHSRRLSACHHSSEDEINNQASTNVNSNEEGNNNMTECGTATENKDTIVPRRSTRRSLDGDKSAFSSVLLSPQTKTSVKDNYSKRVTRRSIIGCVDTDSSSKMTINCVDTESSSKANVSCANPESSAKTSISCVDTDSSLKTNISFIDSELSSKTSISCVDAKTFSEATKICCVDKNSVLEISSTKDLNCCNVSACNLSSPSGSDADDNLMIDIGTDTPHIKMLPKVDIFQQNSFMSENNKDDSVSSICNFDCREVDLNLQNVSSNTATSLSSNTVTILSSNSEVLISEKESALQDSANVFTNGTNDEYYALLQTTCLGNRAESINCEHYIPETDHVQINVISESKKTKSETNENILALGIQKIETVFEEAVTKPGELFIYYYILYYIYYYIIYYNILYYIYIII